jgi:hypothetical protein
VTAGDLPQAVFWIRVRMFASAIYGSLITGIWARPCVDHGAHGALHGSLARSPVIQATLPIWFTTSPALITHAGPADEGDDVSSTLYCCAVALAHEQMSALKLSPAFCVVCFAVIGQAVGVDGYTATQRVVK